MARSSNQSHFATTPRADIPRAKFKRDHNLHTTLDAGYLVPIYVDEVLPGDTFIMKEHVFGRLATPLKPLMDNLYLETFYFFCPNRLVWDNWQKFMGEQDNPSDSIDYIMPTVTINDVPNGSLADYYGLPTNIAADYEVNALPFRAYNLIYNEWFRDQNLQNSFPVPKDDGPDDYSTTYSLVRRGKRHDYFTAALPFPQKGPAVNLPLGTTAPIMLSSATTSLNNEQAALNVTSGGGFQWGKLDPTWSSAPNSTSASLYTDLNGATSATINSLREAFQVQKLFERDARGGTRYTEILRSHFGVVSPDSRQMRPEYLGGSSSRIGVSPVANTTGTADAKQGDLAGVGTVSSSGRGFTYSSTEHGYIIGLVSLRADLNYQQGLNKMWSRQTRLDFYWPALSHLGEQPILNKELYLQGTSDDELVFGYIPRYDEYRYKPNQITGKFRSNDPQSLDIWHLSQDFEFTPALSTLFITENPPMSRVLAVPSEPHLLLDCYFDLDTVRPMPMYSIPGLIDHF